MTAEMARQGMISAEKAAEHPWRHVVTNVLGGKEPGVQVELHSLDLHPNDVILLCSDGLTEMCSEVDIVADLKQANDPRAVCERLVAEANRRGGKDNITVIVARISSAA